MKKETDKLEQFIEDNKYDFDSDFNPERNWNKIESKISKKNRHQRKNMWLVAASVVLLLSVSWLTYEKTQLTNKINELESLTFNGKSFSDIESYYRQGINEKVIQLNQVSIDKNIKVNPELESINKKYEQLKLQVKNQGSHPQLINAMIQNLQIQIEILEQQLNVLQDLQEYNENENPQNNEKSI